MVPVIRPDRLYSFSVSKGAGVFSLFLRLSVKAHTVGPKGEVVRDPEGDMECKMTVDNQELALCGDPDNRLNYVKAEIMRKFAEVLEKSLAKNW